jgi:hypothetical protein
MRKKLLIALGVLLVVVVGFLGVVALQPRTFSIERSTNIAAQPSVVFAELDDFEAWNAWSPWAKLDPNAKTTMSDPSSGKGARFTWSGNDQVGEGSLTMLESNPPQLVEVEQEFVRPMAGKARMAFILVPRDGGTQLTWKMHGKNDFIGRAICMFMNMDALVGKNFEKGLAAIKSLAEKHAGDPATAPAI